MGPEMEIVFIMLSNQNTDRAVFSTSPSLLMSIRNSCVLDHTQFQLTNVQISFKKLGKQREEEKKEWHQRLFKWIFRERKMYVPEEQVSIVRQLWQASRACAPFACLS